ncbi:MAG: IS66 family transposase [Candidatus Diapherotrites archaeon]|nr:IS66 family transposase [Candidatus Diapherotrites archaeon]
MPQHTELELKLMAKIEELEQRIFALEARLRVYENSNTPSSKQRFKKRPRDPNGKLGAPLGHPKWEREQPEPTKTVEHSETQCPHCKHKLDKPIKTDRRVIEEIPKPQPIQVVEHLVNHYHCRHCNKHVVAKNNLPKGMFGINAEALTVLFRFEDRMPLRKTVNALTRFGLDITNVCVQNISQRTAHKLQPEYNKAIQLIRTAPVVYADETEMPIDGKTYWLWTFTTENVTVYVIRKSRSASVPIEILGKNYEGIITSDGHSAYRQIGAEHQRCWAHVIRESKEINEQHSLYKCHHNNLTNIFRKVKRIRENPPPLEKRMQLKKELEKQTIQIADALDGHKEYHSFAVKLRKATPFLFTCIIHLFVEPTNNRAERSLRELIVLRKIIGGLRREIGARILESIATCLTTWKQQGKALLPTLTNRLYKPS